MPVFKEGDVVNVRCIVLASTESSMGHRLRVYPASETTHRDFSVAASVAELVLPKFEVGEWVMSEDGPASIKAIAGEEAWVVSENGPWIAKLKDLKRAPALVQADGKSYAAALLTPPAPPEEEEAIEPPAPEAVIAAVKDMLEAYPNVSEQFCDGMVNGPSFDKGGF
jgi:hypothetical protein